MFSSYFAIFLRNLFRKFGFLYIIRKTNLFNFYSGKYEEKFDLAMQKSLSEGLIVFDIGANVGFYTEKFAEKVGSEGHIYAFEPTSKSANIIKLLKKKFPWITVVEKAVGDFSGKVLFDESASNSSSPTNKIIIKNQSDSKNCKEKKIDTIDSLVEKYKVPNFIKIDVEGFELNVLRGAKRTLKNNNLKHVFVEIHFALLNQRGMPFAAKEIKKILENSGLKVEYSDFSHLHAYRS